MNSLRIIPSITISHQIDGTQQPSLVKFGEELNLDLNYSGTGRCATKTFVVPANFDPLVVPFDAFAKEPLTGVDFPSTLNFFSVKNTGTFSLSVAAFFKDDNSQVISLDIAPGELFFFGTSRAAIPECRISCEQGDPILTGELQISAISL